jgi:hypothetical protein
MQPDPQQAICMNDSKATELYLVEYCCFGGQLKIALLKSCFITYYSKTH